jgi:hypothetical protein
MMPAMLPAVDKAETSPEATPIGRTSAHSRTVTGPVAARATIAGANRTSAPRATPTTSPISARGGRMKGMVRRASACQAAPARIAKKTCSPATRPRWWPPEAATVRAASRPPTAYPATMAVMTTPMVVPQT